MEKYKEEKKQLEMRGIVLGRVREGGGRGGVVGMYTCNCGCNTSCVFV